MLYIRTQDKLSLIEAKRIVVNTTPDCYQILDQSVNGYHVILGVYSTKDNAIKVLDMIEKALEGIMIIPDEKECEKIGLNPKLFKEHEIKRNTDFVFQMPKDEEVK